jgi:hypothetical protein
VSVERFEWLADCVLDGEATAEERAELDRLLAQDPSGRARLAEREELFDTLRRVPRRAPPDDLRDAVLAAIRVESPPVRHEERRDPRSSFFGRHPWLGFGYATAAGLVIGSLITLAVVGALGRGPGRDLPAAGTMAPADAHVVATRALDLPNARFEAEARTGDRVTIVRLSGSSASPAEVELEYEPDQLRLASVLPAEPGDFRIERSAGRVRLTSTGPLHVELRWIPSSMAPSPISIRGRTEEHEVTVSLPIDPRTRESIPAR